METIEQLRVRIATLEAQLDDARSCEAREACRAIQMRAQRDLHQAEMMRLEGENGRIQHSAKQAVQLKGRAETALTEVAVMIRRLKAIADEADGINVPFATGMESGSTKLISVRRWADAALEKISAAQRPLTSDQK